MRETGMLHRINYKLKNWDTHLLQLTVRHASLLMACSIIGLGIWGGLTHHSAYLLGLTIVGAVGYFSGLSVALLTAVVYLLANAFTSWNFHTYPSVWALEVIGYAGVAWLGFRHHKFKEAQELKTKPDQVLPWTVVNEVRTSLSAIRFLLFPLSDHPETEAVQQATTELSRLESLFHELENKSANDQ